MTILRNKNREKYTILDNSIFDSGLPADSIGLFAYLMSKPDSWVIRKTHLMKVFGYGREKLMRMLRDLRQAGYLEIQAAHDETGHLAGSEYILLETPRDGLPDSRGKPTVEKPDPLVNTDNLVNTDKNIMVESFDLAFETFWKAYPKKVKKQPARKAFEKAAKPIVKANGGDYTPQSFALVLCNDINTRMLRDRNWMRVAGKTSQFVPDPTTYLNQARWEDEIQEKTERDTQVRIPNDDAGLVAMATKLRVSTQGKDRFQLTRDIRTKLEEQHNEHR